MNSMLKITKCTRNQGTMIESQQKLGQQNHTYKTAGIGVVRYRT